MLLGPGEPRPEGGGGCSERPCRRCGQRRVLRRGRTDGPTRQKSASSASSQEVDRRHDWDGQGSTPGMNVLSVDGGGSAGSSPRWSSRTSRSGRQGHAHVRPDCGNVDRRHPRARADGAGRRRRAALDRESDLVGFYLTEGPRIFHHSIGKMLESGLGLLDEKFDAKPLEKALATYMGETMISEALTDVLVAATTSRPQAVLLQDRSGEAEARARLGDARGRACDGGGADLLRAREADGGWIDVRAVRRRRLRGQPGDVRLRRGPPAPSACGHPAASRSAPASSRGPCTTTASRTGG